MMIAHSPHTHGRLVNLRVGIAWTWREMNLSVYIGMVMEFGAPNTRTAK